MDEEATTEKGEARDGVLDTDTLKGLLDLQRSTYDLIEASIKANEEKSRNNVVAATGAVGFALLIVKPDVVAQGALAGFGTPLSAGATVAGALALVALVWAAGIVVGVFRQNARVQGLSEKIVVEPSWVYNTLPEEVEGYAQFLRTAASVYESYGTVVTRVLDVKAGAVRRQFVGLNRLIVLTFAYLALGALHLALRAAASSGNVP